MIEGNHTNELQGQLDLTDVLGGGNPSTAEPGTPEGYDAEGNLLDYAPENPTTADAVPLPLKGEARETPQANQISPSPLGKVPPKGADEVPAAAEPAPDRLTALAVEINAITEQTRGVVISAALAVGKRLVEAKGLCPEGRWSEWLEKSVSYSERKAQDMMRLYSEYGRDGQIPDSIAALDYSKAVALLSAPAEAREALALRAEAEDLSVRQLQQEIKALKEENAKAQTMIEWHEHMKDRLDQNINDVENERDEAEKELDEAREAIVDRDRLIREMKERVQEVEGKADAAESAAAELRKLHSDAEDRAAANAQQARDAVTRANRTAKDLAEARAEIARLEEQARSGDNLSPQVETVEVVPEAVTRELEELRAQLAEARANRGTENRESGTGATATERFKLFYTDTMKPAFTTALTLLREVAREDGKAADAFATALTKGCEMLMNQLGEKS